MTNKPTLAALEQLLAGVHKRAAQDGNQALAHAMREALALCRTARTVHAATHVQLQGALLSIHQGRAADAVKYIETAVDIVWTRWCGPLCGGPSPRGETG